MNILTPFLYVLPSLGVLAILLLLAVYHDFVKKTFFLASSNIKNLRQRFEHVFITLELFLIQITFVPIFVYIVSLIFAKYGIPVDVYRLMRSCFVLSFPVLFFLLSFSKYFLAFLLASDTKIWRLLVLGLIISTLSVWFAIDGVGFAILWSTRTDFAALESALMSQIKISYFVIASLIFVYGFRHVERLDAILVRKRSVCFVLVSVIAWATLLYPHVQPVVLNSETYFSPDIAHEFGKKIDIKGASRDIKLRVTCDQAATIADNVANGKSNMLLELYEPMQLPDMSRCEKSGRNEDSHTTWNTTTARPHELCYAIHGSNQHNTRIDESGLIGCIKTSVIGALMPQSPIIDQNINYFQVESISGTRPYRGQTFSIDQMRDSYFRAVQAFIDNSKKWPEDFSGAPTYLGMGSSTGYYTHHYAVILQAFDTQKSLLSFAANQYGFGPLFVANAMQFMGATAYDGVVFAVLLGNTLVLLWMFFLFWKVDIRSQIVLFSGFCFSITLTFLMTNLFAPMTYHLRLLPSLLLFLYMTKRCMNQNGARIGIKSDFADMRMHILFAVAIAVYNFEFGLLTAFGMIIASVIAKRSNYILIYSLSFFGALSFKAYAGGYGATESGTNALGYVSSYWVSGHFDTGLKLITVAALMPFLVFLLSRKGKRSFEEHSLAILYFMILFKPTVVGSSNHGGGLFLITACLAVVFLKSYEKSEKLLVPQIGSYMVVAVLSLPILIQLPSGSFPGGKKLSFEKYQDTNISNIQPVSESLVKRLSDADSLFTDGDLLLSMSDSAVALWTNQKVAEPYFDVSSSVLMPLSEPNIIKAYSKAGSVVVDKIIADANYRSKYLDDIYPFAAISLISPKYWRTLDAMVDMWHTVREENGQGHKECGRSAQFVKYCLADNRKVYEKTE
jgi:hypothetical protein